MITNDHAERRIKKVGLSDLYNLMFQMLSLQSAGMVSDMLVFFSQSVTTTFCCWLPLFRQKAWNFNSLR